MKKKLVYYYDNILQESPVKKYLEQFIPIIGDSAKQQKKKKIILAAVRQKVEYVKSINGTPQPPYAEPLHKYKILKISVQKDQNTLIRILYFCFGSCMVLLSAFEKPSRYNQNDKKINRQLEKEYKKGQDFSEKFKANQNLYEEYF